MFVIFYSLLFIALCRRIVMAEERMCDDDTDRSKFIQVSCMFAIAGLAVGALTAFLIDPATDEHLLSPTMRALSPLIWCAAAGLISPTLALALFIVRSIFSLYGKGEEAVVAKVKSIGHKPEKSLQEIEVLKKLRAELEISNELSAEIDRKIRELKSASINS